MFRAGDQIGPYILTNKIGQGSFGVVWLAERRTAIAVTKAALKIPIDAEVNLDAIKQEASLWALASGHPNVLPIIEADLYEGQIVIASEYAPDGSLDSWMKQYGGKAPSDEAAVEMTIGILAGLEHLHSRQIIHRDLKPANILLQGQIPRLADFGISRVVKATSQSAILAGTPVYMAPEAFDKKRNAQTDVWSVGVIFYQLLSGQLPFPASDMSSLIGSIIRHEPEPLPPQIAGPLQDVVAKALQKDPLYRYQSAAEMRQDLRRAIQAPEQKGSATERRSVAPTIRAHQETQPAPMPVSNLPLTNTTKTGISPHYIYAAAGLAAVLILGGILSIVAYYRYFSNDLPTANATVTQKPTPASETRPTPEPALPQIPPPAVAVPPINPSASQALLAFAEIEAKILKGELLSEAEIRGFSQTELRLLRNTVYARHGRHFQSPELQQHFESRFWYKARQGYDLSDLTANDQANVKLLQKAENG
jgi:serine/threonine-protein kinase